MLTGLYLAGNALVVQAERQDVIAANLANASTAGYRRTRAGVEARHSVFAQALADVIGETDQYQCLSTNTCLDPTAGPLTSTGNPCDLALDGPGYFCLQGESGQVYTRDGSFRLSPDSLLVDRQGRAVLGQQGPIRIDGERWEVGADGTVSVDGYPTATLRIVDFPAETATLLGDGTFTAPAAATRLVAVPRVLQYQVEGSNVRPVEEMVSMITTLRTYEAAQRVIQAQDQTLDRAVNEVGR